MPVLELTDRELETKLRHMHIIVNQTIGKFGELRHTPEQYQQYMDLRSEYIKRGLHDYKRVR
jgi:hypothetical protein